MNTSTKIFFIIALFLISTLLFIMLQQTPTQLQIKDLNNSYLNKEILIQGKILNINNNPKFQSIILQDSTGITRAISFSKKPLNINQTKNITLVGKLELYNNQFQIKANQIIQ